MNLGGHCSSLREFGGADAPVLLELAGKIGLLLVTQAGSGFLDGGAIVQQFHGLPLALLRQPCARRFPQVSLKMAAQRVIRNAATFCEFGYRPVRLPGESHPISYLIQSRIHTITGFSTWMPPF